MAEQLSPAVNVQLFRAWALTFQKRNDFVGAAERHLKALLECRKLGTETLFEARSLNDLGVVALRSGEVSKSDDYFRQSLAIKEKIIPDSSDMASTVNNIGAVAWQRGDLDTAHKYYLRSLAVQQKLDPQSPSTALTLGNLGLLYSDTGDFVKAQEFSSQALAIREKLMPDSSDLAGNLVNLGSIAVLQGRLAQGEQYYRRALAISEKLSPESIGVANSLNGLGLIAAYRGNSAEAEELNRKALLMQRRAAPSNPGIVRSLQTLGVAFAERGDLDRAEGYFTEALLLAQKIAPASLATAIIQTDLGDIALERNDLAEAEKYFRAALTIREKLAPASLLVAACLDSLGRVAFQRRDLNTAKSYYQRALSLQEKLAPEGLDLADSLGNLGELARVRGQLLTARRYCRESLSILKKLAPDSVSYAMSIGSLAENLAATGRPRAAESYYAQALDAFDRQTMQLGGTEETHSMFLAKYNRLYHDYIDLLAKQKEPAAAFHVLERARARSLVELLAEAHIDIRKGVDTSLLQQEQDLRFEINAGLSRRTQILRQPDKDDKLPAINQEIENALSRYRDIEGQIRILSPNYAGLTQSRAVNTEEVQKTLLDADTLLLEYSFGEKHSYVFVVSTSFIDAVTLPPRALIDSRARRLYDLLTARNHRVKGETEEQRHARWMRAEQEYPAAVAKLSQTVLMPIANRLRAKRLLVVSDGALQYIPFAILPENLEPGAANSLPLIAKHEIVNLASATTLAVLRQQFAQRSPAPKAVTVIADPVFDADDDRLQLAVDRKTQAAHADPTRSPLTSDGADEDPGRRSSREIGISDDGTFPRLPFTRHEADAIYTIAGPETADRILDFDANKSAAIGQQLKDYRIVHLATHAMVNNDHPELSGLVFSLVDRQGKSQDGFLRLLDIYNMELNADLVVLSACQTALGKQVQEEGFLGLTRGFMYAGSPRVLASLWNVDDEATAELMKRFYENMLKKGQRPAEALRSAQIWMRSQKAWQSPFYWAGFVLQGEWQ
jgi:CHAT domain-containing protein/Tfp pilus assembly protein PilF